MNRVLWRRFLAWRTPDPAPRPPGRRIEERLARRGGLAELLRLPAALFGGVVGLRGSLYDRRLLPIRGVDVPVVSVGNIAVGGTGKTPLVAWLVTRLAARGLRAGILSRGYRRGGRDARAGGPGAPNDEGRLLAELLPGVPHVQDPDRVRGALELERAGVDVIVLDDGFQHRRLARDLDLVLVDATRPFGLPSLAPRGAPSNAVRALLPRGLLREPPRALARADGLVITRCDAIDTQELRALHAELAAFAPGRPIAHAAHRPVGLRRLRGSSGGGATHGLEWLAGRTVDLVSGIGNPDAFQRTVAGLGAHIGDHRRFPDHHPFAPRELAGLGARPVLVTAKDAARISGDVDPWPDQPGLEVLVLDIALEVVHGAAELDSLLAGLPEAPARRARDASHAGLHG